VALPGSTCSRSDPRSATVEIVIAELGAACPPLVCTEGRPSTAFHRLMGLADGHQRLPAGSYRRCPPDGRATLRRVRGEHLRSPQETDKTI
jgi:hypothetical protein